VRPNFRQRRIVAFTAACRYAKSAPLRCSTAIEPSPGVEAFVGRLESAMAQGIVDSRGTGGAPQDWLGREHILPEA
jgi:hypothetical protein